MNDYSELRAKAEAAVHSWEEEMFLDPASEDFIAAVSPDVVLALLDEVERLRAALERVETLCANADDQPMGQGLLSTARVRAALNSNPGQQNAPVAEGDAP